jgi:uncharacterized protein YkwD
MMTRLFLGVIAVLAGILGALASLTGSEDVSAWAKRLETPGTYTVVATATLPAVLLVEQPAYDEVETKPVATSTEVVLEKKVVQVTKITKSPAVPVTPPKAPANTPPPSPAGAPVTIGAINEKMIIDLTNVERVREGKSVLAWNDKLAKMAYAKAKDMLDRQYFAHESPDGKNVVGLASDAGYTYRLVGENLAVGNFRTNEELIAGWMGSPGHKENILKDEYTEMGAAAIGGVFEGEEVWMAVQEFGTPMPLCDAPDTQIKSQIDTMNTELRALEESIQSARSAIETAPNEDVRTQKITDYNTLVDLYNDLVTKIKGTIATYNQTVKDYNVCIEG